MAGPHHRFVDVFNLDGTPGLPEGNVRLISGGPLNSPWGLAIAPHGFGGLSAPGNDQRLVGNFGDGLPRAQRYACRSGRFTRSSRPRAL